MPVAEKIVPGGDGDAARGIAEAEMYANGVDVLNVGGVPGLRLSALEQGVLARRRYLTTSMDAGFLTVRRQIPPLVE